MAKRANGQSRGAQATARGKAKQGAGRTASVVQKHSWNVNTGQSWKPSEYAAARGQKVLEPLAFVSPMRGRTSSGLTAVLKGPSLEKFGG